MKKLLLAVVVLFSCEYLFSQTETSDFNYFPKPEYNAIIAESNDFENGTTLEKIVIDGFDSRVPFYYITGNNKEEDKFIILLHGITGSKDGWIYPMTSLSEKYVTLKDSFLELGYTIIIPDAKYHGERSYEADFVSPINFASNQDAQSIYNLFATTIKDIRIIMDYIESKSTFKTQSFDVIGYSMGGQMAILLNSVDRRLNRVIACVPPLDAKKTGMRLGMIEEKTKGLDVISPKNYATKQIAPIYLLMGTEDGWYTKSEAQDFYDKISIKDKTLKFYESGHYLPESFINDAIEGITKE